jgi:2-methylaconitate cis-trans-isomerase PrpF
VIDDTGNCGNTSAVVGPLPLRDLIHPSSLCLKCASINQYEKVILAEFLVENGEFISERFSDDGSNSAPILLDFIGSGVGDGALAREVREEVKFLSSEPEFQWRMQQPLCIHPCQSRGSGQ